MRVTQEILESTQTPEAWQKRAGIDPEALGGWFTFVDPYHLDSEAFINGFSAAYPTLPLIGGLASSRVQRTQVYLNGDVFNDGAVCVGIGGNYAVEAVVSQGAEPIGQPWTITGAERNMVQTIGQRPALDVLRDTLELDPAMQERAQRNLLVGLVMDEYRDEFRRGDFLIRNLLGADPNTGVLGISAYPQVGQTIQFQLRDDRAADDELKEMLVRTRERLGNAAPLAAVLCSCNGRGVGLFGQPDHDASMVKSELNLDSVAGSLLQR